MAQTVGTEALRRLAFLAGGTGGRGSGAPTMWAPTWYGGGDRRTLAWTAVCADVLQGGGLHGTMEGGASGEAKLRKSTKYPGGRRVISRGIHGFSAKFPAFCRFGLKFG